jgi:hypothetical protein
MADRLLSTYLNDHLATSLAALELARRAAGSNRGTATGRQLEQLASALQEDRQALQEAMGRLGVGRDLAKLTVGWTAEKVGRLKLNGRLIGYSPLSRVEELELLTLGVEGKLLLWQGLARLRSLEQARLPLDHLIGRARGQLRILRRLRADALEQAFGTANPMPRDAAPRAPGSAPAR